VEVSVGEGVSVCVGTGEGDWVGLDVGKNVTFAVGMDGCAVLVGTSGTGKLTCAMQPVVKVNDITISNRINFVMWIYYDKIDEIDINIHAAREMHNMRISAGKPAPFHIFLNFPNPVTIN
jgi:ABC-type phosphate transport system ATPase subunit